jgi:hypothetical protein
LLGILFIHVHLGFLCRFDHKTATY